MKKIFAILALFLAFTFSANAQESKPNVDATVAANSDFEALNSFMTVDPSLKPKLIQIFKTKHEGLALPNIDGNERKGYMGNAARGLSQVLSKDQMQKLYANNELFDKLTR